MYAVVSYYLIMEFPPAAVTTPLLAQTLLFV